MNSPARRPLRVAATALLLLALQGCFGGLLSSDAPAEETFRIGASPFEPAAAAAAPPESAPAIVVARPRAPATLDTNRIAIAPGGQRFDYYAGARWAEPAPQMMQQALIGALAASGRFSGVLAAPSRTPAEYTLDVELRHFEAISAAPGAAPTVLVQVQASLVDARRGVRLTSFVSESRAPTSENRRAAIVAAFERASSEVAADVAARAAEAASARQHL